MAENYYLILDQGGSSSRAIVFDGTGNRIAIAQQQLESSRPGPGRVEQDPLAIVASLKSVADAVVQELSSTQCAGLAAGLVCQRSSMVCWDAVSGQPLSPVISWQDTRAHQYLESLALDQQAIYQKTGLIANAHYGASKMRWCLDHLPAVQRAAQHRRLRMAPLASYLLSALLEGAPYKVDPANASRTLLFNFHSGSWDAQLIESFGLDKQYLPDITATLAPFGKLHCGGSAIDFCLLSGDQSAAAFASGKPEEGVVTVNLGTGAFLMLPIAKPDFSQQMLNSIILWDEGPHYVLEGTVNGAGSALQWYVEKAGLSSVEQAVDAAVLSTSEPGIFLNGIGGLGSPDWRPDFKSEFVVKGDSDQQVLAIVESIVFLLQRNLELLRQNHELHSIVISGGLSRQLLFCQLLADLSGLSVRRSSETEATARGACFILAAYPEHWQQGELQDFTPAANPGLHSRYQQWAGEMAQALASQLPVQPGQPGQPGT